MTLVQPKSPTQAYTSDDDYVKIGTLFAVESHVDETVGWVVECRVGEGGYGTPLLWYDLEVAEQWVKDRAEETGCYGDQRVIGFALTFRGEAPVRCECCGRWGHAEMECANDDHDHTCVNDGDERQLCSRRP